MRQVDLIQAQNELPQIIEAVLHGAEIVITRDETPAVKLVPLPTAKPRPQFGSAKGLVTLSDDFDEPLEDFQEYLQ